MSGCGSYGSCVTYDTEALNFTCKCTYGTLSSYCGSPCNSTYCGRDETCLDAISGSSYCIPYYNYSSVCYTCNSLSSCKSSDTAPHSPMCVCKYGGSYPDCAGTPCGSSSCFENETCTQTADGTPTCVLSSDYYRCTMYGCGSGYCVATNSTPTNVTCKCYDGTLTDYCGASCGNASCARYETCLNSTSGVPRCISDNSYSQVCYYCSSVSTCKTTDVYPYDPVCECKYGGAYPNCSGTPCGSTQCTTSQSCLDSISGVPKCVDTAERNSKCYNCGNGYCVATDTELANVTCKCYNYENYNVTKSYCGQSCGSTNCDYSENCLMTVSGVYRCAANYSECNSCYLFESSCRSTETEPYTAYCNCDHNGTFPNCNGVPCGSTHCSLGQRCLNSATHVERCVTLSEYNSVCYSCGNGECVSTDTEPANVTCKCYNTGNTSSYCGNSCGGTTCGRDETCLSSVTNVDRCIPYGNYSAVCYSCSSLSICKSSDTEPYAPECVCRYGGTYPSCTKEPCGSYYCSEGESCLVSATNVSRCVPTNEMYSVCYNCGYGHCVATDTEPANVTCQCYQSGIVTSYCGEYCGGVHCDRNDVCLNSISQISRCVSQSNYSSICSSCFPYSTTSCLSTDTIPYEPVCVCKYGGSFPSCSGQPCGSSTCYPDEVCLGSVVGVARCVQSSEYYSCYCGDGVCVSTDTIPANVTCKCNSTGYVSNYCGPVCGSTHCGPNELCFDSVTNISRCISYQNYSSVCSSCSYEGICKATDIFPYEPICVCRNGGTYPDSCLGQPCGSSYCYKNETCINTVSGSSVCILQSTYNDLCSCGNGECVLTDNSSITCRCYSNGNLSSYCGYPCGSTNCGRDDTCLESITNVSRCVPYSNYSSVCYNCYSSLSRCASTDTMPYMPICACIHNGTYPSCSGVACGSRFCSPDDICLNSGSGVSRCVRYEEYMTNCMYGYCGNGYCVATDTEPANTTCQCYNGNISSYCGTQCGNGYCLKNEVCLNSTSHVDRCVSYDNYTACYYCTGLSSCMATDTFPYNAMCVCKYGGDYPNCHGEPCGQYNCTEYEVCLDSATNVKRCVSNSQYYEYCYASNCGNGRCVSTDSHPANVTCECYNNGMLSSYCGTPCGNNTCSRDEICLSSPTNASWCVPSYNFSSVCYYCPYGSICGSDDAEPHSPLCYCPHGGTYPDCFTRNCGDYWCSSMDDVCLYSATNVNRCVPYSEYYGACYSCGNGYCVSTDTEPANATCKCYGLDITSSYCGETCGHGNITCGRNEKCLPTTTANYSRCVPYSEYSSVCSCNATLSICRSTLTDPPTPFCDCMYGGTYPLCQGQPCGNKTCQLTETCLLSATDVPRCVQNTDYSNVCYSACGNGHCVSTDTEPANVTCKCYDDGRLSSYCGMRCGNATCSRDELCMPSPINNSWCVPYSNFSNVCYLCNWLSNCYASEEAPHSPECVCRFGSNSSTCLGESCGSQRCSDYEYCVNSTTNIPRCVNYVYYVDNCYNCSSYERCAASDVSPYIPSCVCKYGGNISDCFGDPCGGSHCRTDEVCLSSATGVPRCVLSSQYQQCSCEYGHCVSTDTMPYNVTCKCDDGSVSPSCLPPSTSPAPSPVHSPEPSPSQSPEPSPVYSPTPSSTSHSPESSPAQSPVPSPVHSPTPSSTAHSPEPATGTSPAPSENSPAPSSPSPSAQSPEPSTGTSPAPSENSPAPSSPSPSAQSPEPSTGTSPEPSSPENSPEPSNVDNSPSPADGTSPQPSTVPSNLPPSAPEPSTPSQCSARQNENSCKSSSECRWKSASDVCSAENYHVCMNSCTDGSTNYCYVHLPTTNYFVFAGCTNSEFQQTAQRNCLCNTTAAAILNTVNFNFEDVNNLIKSSTFEVASVSKDSHISLALSGAVSTPSEQSQATSDIISALKSLYGSSLGTNNLEVQYSTRNGITYADVYIVPDLNVKSPAPTPSSLSPGAIAGIVIAVIIVILIVVFASIAIQSKGSKPDDPNQPAAPYENL
eukprot:TRINITY_DN3747_c0_g3_i6.p1 TRINITY_DN3747_c0_g3~~TRINITY_DN3747_c0_g3_i6.p1  ORF type:complete len:2121 (-),score=205.52 TRINITY_DN3747_c0_g3_i6:27-6011(-)